MDYLKRAAKFLCHIETYGTIYGCRARILFVVYTLCFSLVDDCFGAHLQAFNQERLFSGSDNEYENRRTGERIIINNPPSSWNYAVTENSHTVILPSNLKANLAGQKMEKGDYVGIFFQRDGNMVCGGYTLWEGKGTSFPVFGDDATTPQLKDGFSPGELFTVKLWRTSDQLELSVNATYAETGTPSINGNNKFITDAVSMILELYIPISLEISLKDIEFDAKGGVKQLKITSNTSWVVAESLEFISLSQNTGIGDAAISFSCLPNESTLPRSGTVEVSGLGVQNQIVRVTQAAASPYLEVGVPHLGYDYLPGKKVVTVASNISWSVFTSEKWIETNIVNGKGNDSIFISVLENSDKVSRSGTVRIKSPENNIERTISILQDKNPVLVPESWKYVQTENSHTIILPVNLESDIEGSPLQTGDIVGVFYKISGREDGCAGYGVWKGGVTTFPVFGDDVGTSSIKEGFANGETFMFRIWKSSVNKEFKAEAIYAPPGSLGIVNAAGQFAPDAFSMVNKLAVSKKETLEISFSEGWNTVSSYIIPDISLLDSIIRPVSDKIRFVKNGAGQSYILGLNANTIGSWKITEGYRINATSPGVLKITGNPVDLSSIDIQVRSGWQIIPFFGRTPKSPEEAFANLGGNIEALKDNTGRIYLPGVVNAIGSLLPTQGYRLKAKAAGTFRYPPNYMSAFTNELWTKRFYTYSDTLQYFKLKEGYNTGISSNIVILASGLKGGIEIGDEVGVFPLDTAILCGAARFSGDNLALTVWGDDNEKQGRQGLRTDEKYQLKIWKKRENLVYNITAEYSVGSGTFREDNIEIINGIKFSTTRTIDIAISDKYQLFPNPTTGYFSIVPKKITQGDFEIQIFSYSGHFMGRYLHGGKWRPGEPVLIDISNYPSGMYLVKLMSEDEAWTGRVTLYK